MGVYCAVAGCLSSSTNDKNRSFFRFPKDERRYKQWIQACDRGELWEKSMEALSKHYVICDLHFQSTDRLIKKLKSIAVPTLNLPRQNNSKPSQSTQTPKVVICSPNTNTVASQTSFASAKSLSRSKSAENQATEANTQVLTQPLSYMSQLQKLTVLQNRLLTYSCGSENDENFKLFALNLYLTSPWAYKLLTNKLSFPSVKALRSMNLKIETKMNSNVLKCLEAKFRNYKGVEKYCIICAEEISLKPNLYYQINEDRIIGFHEIDGTHTSELATKGFVIMAKGLYSTWQQPLGFCFLDKNYEEINAWLDKRILNIINIGLLVVAFVSKQNTMFLNLAKERNVTIEQPYFIINQTKIYYIFDVTNLVKSMRNNLMKYDFEFQDGDGTKLTAKWEHVKTLYKHDCGKPYRLAPNLTESHVNPNNLEKKEVEYATQVFNNGVAVAMNCLIECGRLEKSALGTVQLIELVDKVLNVFDPSAVEKPKRLKNASERQKTLGKIINHFEYFLYNACVLNSAKKNVTKAIKCLDGFKITINSFKSLSQDLKFHGLNCLFKNALNQEPMKTMFGLIRLRNGKYRKPTPFQLSRIFNKQFMINIVKHSEREKRSVEGLDQLLQITEDLMEPRLIQGSLTIVVGTKDYRFELPAQKAFVNVCCYLLKKCFDIHRCPVMGKYVQTDDESVHQKTVFIVNPPDTFLTCIKNMDDRFRLFFQKNNLVCIGHGIMRDINDNDITFNDCCRDFPNQFLKKLFVRFRLFHTVRLNNRLKNDKPFQTKLFDGYD